ncbi:sugar transferase [Mucilaginibacter sp. JRF]|uniref:exopolysaccharide biosynthesis polyprenyl glycosylphosphotransferase n=1 Tax=Mucilaginibacter sp. JRF TaxID=2780088 RepID=UPI0018823184|nr:sugar transferase [Mucilaginibacter sp. JRF]
MRFSKLLRPFTFVLDLFVLNFSLQLANFLVINYFSSEAEISHFILLINLTWISIASITRSYEIKRPLNFAQNINRFLTAVTYHLVMVLGIIYFFKLYEVSRILMITTYFMFILFIVAERSVIFFTLDYIRKKGYNLKHILIIGDVDVSDRVKNTFKKYPEYGYNFVKVISTETFEAMNSKTLFEQITKAEVREVFICYKTMNQLLLSELVRFGSENGIKMKLVPDLSLNNNFANIVNYKDFPVIELSESIELSLKVKLFKRSFDIVFSLLVMIAGLPLFLILTIITKLSSKGPIFYMQERLGRNERPFKIYKFRSMYIDAESCGPRLSSDNDPRITKWGRIIRKSRLDELPQFWNVFKGEMSIVGPRPERQFFVEQLLECSPNYKKLLRLKPGLTSLGQINYGYAESVNQMRDRVRYDLIYLKNINFGSEIAIILQTIKVMTQLKGK